MLKPIDPNDPYAKQKRFYRKNKEIYITRSKAHNAKYRDKYFALKKPCIICGESDPHCIDFHHVNPEDKKFGISFLMSNRMDWNLILEEVKKCVCLCANCHRKFHAGKIKLPERLGEAS